MAGFWIYFEVRAIGFTDELEAGGWVREELKVRILTEVWKHLLLKPRERPSAHELT